MPIKKLIIRGNEVPTFTGVTTALTATEPDKEPQVQSLTLKRSFHVETGGLRGGMEEHTVDIAENNMIELVFDDNTTWFSGPSSIEEIFPSAAAQKRSADDGFVLPQVLETGDAERGIVEKIALKVVNIFIKPKIQAEVRELAKTFERNQLDNKIGLFRLDRDFTYQPFTPENTNLPYLCFLHGTASSTTGSFGELKGTALWSYINTTYGNRILAFQHESLSESPLYNALQLIKQLPNNATLDLISHSRGGLIGEILCRYAVKDEGNRGFDKWERDFLLESLKQNASDNNTVSNPIAAGDNNDNAASKKKTKPRAGKQDNTNTNDNDVPGLQSDVYYIEAIDAEIKSKKITVRKFIRVACPAAGTILASKRLDNFLNMLFNIVGLSAGIAAAPVYEAFRNLLTAVVDSKNKKNILPGLEAMNPESDFIKVLNRPETTVVVDTPLRIISGNCKVKLSLKALVIIASKLFYLQDNDLVVNTRSMYHGTTSRPRPQFYFDEATNVDHFSYFKNESTRKAILNALKATDDELLPDYRLITPGILAGSERNALLGIDSGQLYKNIVSGTKPIVLLLPGIMGSNIKIGDDLVWIDYWDFIKGGLDKIEITAAGATATSLVASSYGRLASFLESKYDVVTVPYDWRRSLVASATEFNDKVKGWMEYNQPIKVIAHSMGGVLFRDFIINHPETWNNLKQTPEFKVIFLGTPMAGSFRIPAVLSGIDSIIKTLSKIDIRHTKQDLVKIFAKFPGLLNLLPIHNTNEFDFADLATWRRLINYIDWETVWNKNELSDFGNYRKQVSDSLVSIDFSNMVYIAGKSKDTYSGIREEGDEEDKELIFLSTGEGDGSVTWETGIPNKMIENNAVYYVNVPHGSLANTPSIFNGILELLATGQTSLLSRKKPLVRSSEKVFISPVKETFDVSQHAVVRTLLGLEAEETTATVVQPIKVWVSNGDLKYAEYPVLAGHFKSDAILYAEKEIDKNLEFALSERHKIGIYPGDIGTNEVFLFNDDSFAGAVIAGLGKFGELTAYQLTITVEQAVSNYLLTLYRNTTLINNTANTKSYTGLSALLVGSAYGGLSVDGCVRAIIQGVQNANAKVRKLKDEITGIQELEFIELYEDTALACFYSLSKIEKEEGSTLNISLSQKTIKQLFGRKQRLPSDATADWWKRISVRLLKPEVRDISIQKNETLIKVDTPVRNLQFSASTGGAREEQRMLYSSTKIIEHILEDMSVKNLWNERLAKTVFELLVPNDFKEQLKKQGNINWILDKNTASYPWELLQDTVENAKPLCVNAGMIRQFATEDSRFNIQQVSLDTALVIADPNLKGFLPQLAGAQEEGRIVNQKLTDEGYDIRYIPSGSSPEIIEALFSRDYKIVHLAGHGLFDAVMPENSGMAIGREVILSPREINQMSTTPELVFVNCCYLGQMSGVAEAYTQSRYKLAANIGTQLIDNGVKAVVVAGWAVDDAAALDFTRKFYDCMFEGSNFGDATKEARKLVYEKYKTLNNTWGAYQCYGDPFYKIKPPIRSKKKTYSFVIAEQADIELSNLRNKLDTGIRLQADFLEDVSAISKAVDDAGIRNALITEKEALIYTAINEYDLAIQKFEQLRTLEDASFTISTLEKYCNVRAKKYIADYNKRTNEKEDYITKIKEVLRDIATLLHVSPTAERYGIMASTYKRLAYVTKNRTAKVNAYKSAAYYYKKADERKTHSNSAYAFTNQIAIESILVAAGIYNWGEEVKRITDDITVAEEKEGNGYSLPVKEEADKTIADLLFAKSKITEKSDFYELAAVANLQFAALLLKSSSTPSATDDTNKPWQEVKKYYQKVWAKAGTKAQKITEIEHLELLTDALGLVESEDFKPLKDSLQRLKDDLEKLI